MDFQIFDVASVSMNREHLRIRQAADHIANANNVQRNAFSEAEAGEDAPATTEAASTSEGPANTVEDFMTIMTASRIYEANVTVISAARAAFEKALEISGRR